MSFRALAAVMLLIAALGAAGWLIVTGSKDGAIAMGGAIAATAALRLHGRRSPTSSVQPERHADSDDGAAAGLEEFDLAATVEELRAGQEPMARERGISLTCDVSPRLPRRVRGDVAALRRVLGELIGNALKFTTSGGVVVHVVTDRDDGRRVQLCISVSDTGPGVAADGMQRLYRMLSSSSAGEESEQASGLGMCKRLVQAMGGQIALASEAGRGATFWFTMEVERAAGDQAAVGGAVDLRSARVWVACAGDEAEKLGIGVMELGLNLVDHVTALRSGCDIMIVVIPTAEAARDVLADVPLPAGARPGVVAALPENFVGGEKLSMLREAGVDAFVQMPVEEAMLADALAFACGACADAGRRAA